MGRSGRTLILLVFSALVLGALCQGDQDYDVRVPGAAKVANEIAAAVPELQAVDHRVGNGASVLLRPDTQCFTATLGLSREVGGLELAACRCSELEPAQHDLFGEAELKGIEALVTDRRKDV